MCWKLDWNILCSNRLLFSAIREYLANNHLVLITQQKNIVNGNNQPCGYYAIFAAGKSNRMMIRSIVTREFLLPEHPSVDFQIPFDIPVSVKENVRKCFAELPSHQHYNPGFFQCGLYDHFNKSLNKSNQNKSKGRNISIKPMNSRCIKTLSSIENTLEGSAKFLPNFKRQETITTSKSASSKNCEIAEKTNENAEALQLKEKQEVEKMEAKHVKRDPEFSKALGMMKKCFDHFTTS